MTEAEYVNQMLQGLLPQLNQAGTPYYLPTIIQTKTAFDPQSNPYVGYSAGGWDFGYLSGPEGTQGAQNICTAVQPFGSVYIPPPGPNNTPDISMSNIMVQNLSMATATSLTADGPDSAIMIHAQINWGALSAHGITGIQITGSFSIVQRCCSAPDGTTCTPNTITDNTGSGSFTLSIGSATVKADIPITALAPNVLTLGVQSIDFEGDPNSMNVTVQIDNIPHQQAWQQHAEKILNLPSTKAEFNQKISQQLLSDQSQIAAALTQNIDSYLQATHQYPYNNSFLAVF